MALDVSAVVAGLAQTAIAGVKTKATEPPRRVSDAMLPMSYPRVPSVTRTVRTVGYGFGLDTMNVDLVILVRSMQLSTQGVNYGVVMDLIDSINTGLAGVADDWQLDSWTVREAEDSVDGVPYWALVVSVEASG